MPPKKPAPKKTAGKPNRPASKTSAAGKRSSPSKTKKAAKKKSAAAKRPLPVSVSTELPTPSTLAPAEASARQTDSSATSAPTLSVAEEATVRSGVPADLVHYYRLVTQVAPGGSRKAEFFVAGTLDEIKAAAEADLGCGEGAYHAIFYGETIVLQCWEGTEKVQSIDLHPFITYRVEGIDEPITFTKPGDEAALDMYDDRYQDLLEELLEEAIDVSVTIDWAQVMLPTLRGRPLTKTELAPFANPEHPWAYGLAVNWDTPLPDP